MNSWMNVGGWMNSYDRWAASSTFNNYFDPTEIGNLQAYVAEAVAAINNGEKLDEQTITNLQEIQRLVELLDSIGIGENVTAGIAEGMTEADWDTDAESVAANLEAAINTALQIESPSKRMKPAGEQVAAGIGIGMTEYDLSADATTLESGIVSAVEAALPPDILASVGTSAATGLANAMTSYSMAATGSAVASGTKSAVSGSLNNSTLRPVGVNAMRGLEAGINAGRSGVISAMRSAARAAVNAAKAELQIRSPSSVFENEVGVMTMRGFGVGVVKESKAQAKIVSNAARYLTTAAQGGIGSASYDNRRTYNQNTTSTIQVDKLYVRDEQDIRSLAVEIATLTRRQQRGKGMRLA